MAQKVVDGGLNYRSIFYAPRNPVFNGREHRAIGSVSSICTQVTTWNPDDTLQDRSTQIVGLLGPFGTPTTTAATAFLGQFPLEMTLGELRDYMGTLSDEKRVRILDDVRQRSGNEVQLNPGPEKIRVMTMHGAKGLSAEVVFVPGLEEEVFPGPRRRPFPGLIEEAARLLYVSITRAKALCALSFADRRVVNGRSARHTASRYNRVTGGAFVRQTGGLPLATVAKVIADRNNL